MQSRPCPNCGRPVSAQATACVYCGARFQPASQRAPARPASSYPPDRPAHAAPPRPRPASSSYPPSRPSGPSAARTRPPTSPAARSRLPTQPPGGEQFRQRPGIAPPPAGPGAPPTPAPRKNNTRLILLLAALVGLIIGGTIGILAFTSKGAPTGSTAATPTSAASNIFGVVSFTASGGLQGAISISLPPGATAASFIQNGPSGKVLEIVVNSASMNFELLLSPYAGPGSYTLLPFQTNPAPGSIHGTASISSHQTTWSLHPPAQCQVTVTSDTSLHRQVQNKPLNEVKGTFACPTLAPDSGSAAPVTITQGQFDVDALVIGS